MYSENVDYAHISLMTELGSCCELDRYSTASNLRLAISDPVLYLDLPDPVFWFTRLKAKVEGRGEGTRLMRRLVEILDERGITVVNALNPYGSMDVQALTEFYKKYGFSEVEEDLMVRKCQTRKAT